jgi:protocatechuate 3,4-dioxygenase alpha subunit
MPLVPTPSQTVGPFFGIGLPFLGDRDVASGLGVIRIEGRLLDGEGDPVPDGLLEAWSGDQLGRCRTGPDGWFRFRLRRPETAPGPEGTVQAPHLEITIFARGLLRHLQTRMYLPDEAAANARDWVLGRVAPARRPTLIAAAVEGGLRFDVRLRGERETVFFAL